MYETHVPGLRGMVTDLLIVTTTDWQDRFSQYIFRAYDRCSLIPGTHKNACSLSRPTPHTQSYRPYHQNPKTVFTPNGQPPEQRTQSPPSSPSRQRSLLRVAFKLLVCNLPRQSKNILTANIILRKPRVKANNFPGSNVRRSLDA